MQNRLINIISMILLIFFNLVVCRERREARTKELADNGTKFPLNISRLFLSLFLKTPDKFFSAM
jgi:hypothetical protein